MKPRLIHRILAALLLLLILVGCSAAPESVPEQTPTASYTPVSSKSGVWATGTVILTSSLNLSFPIAGQVAAMNVEEGDAVRQGIVIARLDTGQIRQAIAEADANLKIAEADLLAVKTAGTPGEIAVAQARVNFSKVQLESAKLQMRRATLYAPMDGTILDIFIQAHEYAGVGQRVVQMGDLNDLSIEVWLDEIDVAGLQVGEPAEVTFEAFPGATSRATITSFAPNPDRVEQRGLKVTLKLLDIPKGLRWGMTADVIFEK